jgi:hypothetical protein
MTETKVIELKITPTTAKTKKAISLDVRFGEYSSIRKNVFKDQKS